jgi:hypothetical protein
MALTVEQKINMLILAGFQPMLSRSRYTRIIGNGVGIGGRMVGADWAVGRHASYNPKEYTPTTWEALPDIGEIPDELIYEACDANR